MLDLGAVGGQEQARSMSLKRHPRPPWRAVYSAPSISILITWGGGTSPRWTSESSVAFEINQANVEDGRAAVQGTGDGVERRSGATCWCAAGDFGLMAGVGALARVVATPVEFQGARQMLEGFRVELNRASSGTVAGLVEVMPGVIDLWYRAWPGPRTEMSRRFGPKATTPWGDSCTSRPGIAKSVYRGAPVRPVPPLVVQGLAGGRGRRRRGGSGPRRPPWGDSCTSRPGIPVGDRGAPVRPVPPLVVQGLAGAEDEDVEAVRAQGDRRGGTRAHPAQGFPVGHCGAQSDPSHHLWYRAWPGPRTNRSRRFGPKAIAVGGLVQSRPGIASR